MLVYELSRFVGGDHLPNAEIGLLNRLYGGELSFVAPPPVDPGGLGWIAQSGCRRREALEGSLSGDLRCGS